MTEKPPNPSTPESNPPPEAEEDLAKEVDEILENLENEPEDIEVVGEEKKENKTEEEPTTEAEVDELLEGLKNKPEKVEVLETTSELGPEKKSKFSFDESERKERKEKGMTDEEIDTEERKISAKQNAERESKESEEKAA